MRAKVVGVEHGTEFTDGLTRVTFKIEEADSMYNRLRIPVRDADGKYVLGLTYKLDFNGPAVKP